MSGNAKTVRVVVLDDDIFGSINPRAADDDSLLGAIEYLEGILEQVPAEHRDDCRMRISSVMGYESCHNATIEIYYDRPETENETAQRLKQEIADRARQEAQERAAYERLKQKFG